MANNEPLGETHILVPANEINNCLRIAVYNRRAFEQVTLYNLEEIYNSLGNAKKELVREDYTSSFTYILGDLKNGFNTVIYLSSTSQPLGFTELYNDQGLRYSVEITIHIEDSVIEGGGIEIKTEYKTLRGTGDTYRKFDWKSIGDLKKEAAEHQDFRYTPSITEHGGVIYQGINSCIDNELYGIKLTRGVDIDPVGRGYTKFSLSMWAGKDIILGCWNTNNGENNDGDYRVVSLTLNDWFGNPKQYFIGKNLPNPENVLYMSGRHVVYSDGRVWNMDKERLEDENIIPDPFDVYGRYYTQPSSDSTYEDVIIKIPKLKNTYIDLKTFMQSQILQIYRKTGSWWILGHTEKEKKIYALLSDRAIIYLTEEEMRGISIINSGSFLLRTSDTTYNLFLVPERGGYYVTDKVKDYMRTEEGEWKLPGYVHSSRTLDEPERIVIGEELKNSPLLRFRRGPFISEVPEVLGSIYGLILYKKDNNIFYL